jgi:molybdopterin-containing oxidoreductase family membrane subunit
MNQSTSLQKYLLGVACAGLLAGAWGIIEALMYGTHATGLTSYVPWGLGVALYLTFLGFSAGGLPLALATTVFGKHEYEELSGLVAWTVVVMELCAGLAIVLDLGHMERMYRFITAPAFTSPMAWMFVFFNALLLVYAIKIWALLNKNTALAYRMTVLSIPVALLFYGTNGYIFGVLNHHPIWGGALTPLYFVVAALMAGTALMCFLSWALGYKPKLTMGVGYGVLTLILLFALLEILIGLTGFQSGDTDTKLALNAILTGGNGTVFWTLHVGLGMVVPVILLLRHTASASALASFCVMASFLATRWVFVIPPQSVPPLPGLDQAFIHERLALTYTPHLGEWLMVLFVFSLALLGFVLGPRLLPGLFQQGGKNV